MRAQRLAVVALLGLTGCAPSLNFTLPDLDGNEVTPLSDGNVVVLAFWATWCGPCQRELAEMNEMYLRLHPRGLELYAISVDGPDTLDNVETWVQSNHYAFPVLIESGSGLFAWFSPTASIPYLVVFNAEGERIETRRGYSPSGVAELEAFLETQLEPAEPRSESTRRPDGQK
ncbi:MAG: TlpA disulfide reductase family protein [Nannocystales bacterium]